MEATGHRRPGATRPLTLRTLLVLAAVAAGLYSVVGGSGRVSAQASSPELLNPALDVETAASGLTTPIGMAFLSASEWFVIEKQTGRVQVLVDGVWLSS
jgi:glucose/arabinose dehydrogenase